MYFSYSLVLQSVTEMAFFWGGILCKQKKDETKNKTKASVITLICRPEYNLVPPVWGYTHGCTTFLFFFKISFS